MRRLTWRAAVGGACALLAAAAADRAYVPVRRLAACQRPPAGAFELYVVGESTPAGEPFGHDVSLGPVVARMLGGRAAGRPITIFPLARHGQSIYPQEVALERALECRDPAAPAAVLIYSGNNDEGARFGAPSWLLALQTLIAASPLARDLWFVLEDHVLLARARTFETYEFFLRRAVEVSLAAGARPVVSTVASNEAGIDPPLFSAGSLSRSDVSRLLDAGEALERSGKPREALAYDRALADGRPELREYLRWEMARCELALGRARRARGLFRAAIDDARDDNFKRATDVQNDLIRRLGRQYGIAVVDAAAEMARRSPDGAIDGSLIVDGHHPGADGHLLIDQAFAQAVAALFSARIVRRFRSGEELLADSGYDGRRRAVAATDGGRWLFSAAAHHWRPRPRLELAYARFSEAARLDPGNLDARLGRVLCRAAERGFLDEPGHVELLARNHLFYSPGPYEPEPFNELLADLSKAGVSADEMVGIRSAYGAGRGGSR